jgi:hypothetical protein
MYSLVQQWEWSSVYNPPELRDLNTRHAPINLVVNYRKKCPFDVGIVVGLLILVIEEFVHEDVL